MARVSEPRAGVLLQGTAQPAPGGDPCGVKVPAQEACLQFPLLPAGARKVRHLKTHPCLMRGGVSCQLVPPAPGKWSSWGLVAGRGSAPHFRFTFAGPATVPAHRG